MEKERKNVKSILITVRVSGKVPKVYDLLSKVLGLKEVCFLGEEEKKRKK